MHLFAKAVFYRCGMKGFFTDLLISRFLRSKKPAHLIAYLAVMMALSVIGNMFLEFKLFDTQFSFTIAISAMIGYIAGPVVGFAICFFGDLLGFFVNSGGMMYMFWVGLSTGGFAFFAGLFAMREAKKTVFAYVKVALFCIASFLVCTIGINSLGFYIYNMNIGFSKAVRDYIAATFGGEDVTFFGYVLYRLIFKLQILNSIFNYILVFIGFTAFNTIPPLKKLLNDDRQVKATDRVDDNEITVKSLTKCEYCGCMHEGLKCPKCGSNKTEE